MKKFKLFLLAIASLLVAVSASAETGSTIVFSNDGTTLNGDGTGKNYSSNWRIPALAMMNDGSILAVADERSATSGGDPTTNQKTYLVGRWSYDNGKTWGDPFRLFPDFTITKTTTTGSGPNQTTTNTVWYPQCDAALAVNGNKVICGLCMGGNFSTNCSMYYSIGTYSTGTKTITWETPKAMTFTNQDAISSKISYASFIASGHMLSDDDGTIWFCFSGKSDSGGQEYMWVAYSKDGGDTWTVANPDDYYKASESKAVQLSDGSILISTRDLNLGNRQFVPLNENSDGSYSLGSSIGSVKDPTCNGAIISYVYNGTRYLVQSHCNSSSRSNVTLSYSTDEGKTWTSDYVVCSGASQYSDLINIGNNQIGVLVEEGTEGSGNLVFHYIDFYDLLPAQTEIDETPEFDGTLQAYKERYVTIPRSEVGSADLQPWDVAEAASTTENGGDLTITLKCRFRVDNSSDFGVFGSRAYKYNSDWTKNITGYELYRGECTNVDADNYGDIGFGFNVSPTYYYTKTTTTSNWGWNQSTTTTYTYSGVYSDNDNANLNHSNVAMHGSVLKAGDGGGEEGRWGHIALVFHTGPQYTDSSTGEVDGLGYVKVYFDGELKETQTYGKNLQYTNSITRGTTCHYSGRPMESYLDFLIGARYDVNNRHDGEDSETLSGYTVPEVHPDWIWPYDIDDFRVYNTAFTAEEVAEDMNSGFPISNGTSQGGNLLFAHDFASLTSATEFEDISGNGHNAVMCGSDFPSITEKVTVTPLLPETDNTTIDNPVTMGYLYVYRYTNGQKVQITTGEDYMATPGEDFQVSAEPSSDEYELLGIYVDGVPVLQNSFIKASTVNEETVIKAVFRKKTEKAIFIVGTLTDHQLLEKYRFSPVSGVEGKYEIASCDLHSRFHLLDITFREGKDKYGDLVYYPIKIYGQVGDANNEPVEGSEAYDEALALYNNKFYAIHMYGIDNQLYWKELKYGVDWDGDGVILAADASKALGDKYVQGHYDTNFVIAHPNSNYKHMLNMNVSEMADAYHFRAHPDGLVWNGEEDGVKVTESNTNTTSSYNTLAMTAQQNAILGAKVTLYYPANPTDVKKGATPINYFVIEGGTTGVDNITVSADEDAPVEYYNLSGIRVNGDNLTPGIYIVRQGKNVTKRIIK